MPPETTRIEWIVQVNKNLKGYTHDEILKSNEYRSPNNNGINNQGASFSLALNNGNTDTDNTEIIMNSLLISKLCTHDKVLIELTLI